MGNWDKIRIGDKIKCIDISNLGGSGSTSASVYLKINQIYTISDIHGRREPFRLKLKEISDEHFTPLSIRFVPVISNYVKRNTNVR